MVGLRQLFEPTRRKLHTHLTLQVKKIIGHSVRYTASLLTSWQKLTRIEETARGLTPRVLGVLFFGNKLKENCELTWLRR
jgi:hypothetical protein